MHRLTEEGREENVMMSLTGATRAASEDPLKAFSNTEGWVVGESVRSKHWSWA